MHIFTYLHTTHSYVEIFTDQDQSDEDSDAESEYRAGPVHNDDSSDEDFSSPEASN